jgi:hypothetical protein
MAKNIDEYIALYNSRLEASDERLSRNWTTQIVLVFLSIYSFAEGDRPVIKLAEKFIGFEANTGVLRAIVVTLLLYNFMRFGFLLGTFGNMRLACESLLKNILKDNDGMKNPIVSRLFDTANFFEPLFQPEKKFVVLLVLVVTTVVAALSHTCMFIHIYMIAGLGLAIILGLIMLAILIPFYVEFYSSTVAKLHVGAKIVAWITPLLALLLSGIWAYVRR